MKVTGVIDEDFNHYRKPSLLISMPKCSGKCGKDKCHNAHLMEKLPIVIDDNLIINKYLSNELTSAIVIAGLEPFDSWYELYEFIKKFRQVSNDDIVIYTGYEEDFLFYYVGALIKFPNIIVKFGPYIEGHEKHYDAVLGMYLASDNQYAKVIGGDYFAEDSGYIHHPK